ncbi:MAG: ChbG/HpnK family deacetylase [Desulfobacteraceae bacterium]|uniref:ChbG/HpnK family deacetylase n=1 Tax=Candidatus Desulfacyla euxinica TaxID=2841693 RepID=A0A8J6T207_9DELT|nr:ChbG/HpnK family deacetylase [Candidatus Desulfacyla euxinica]MBL6979060.1 ChbG/HpnK family deacetylase [Desulfobacteraceae bacterium]
MKLIFHGDDFGLTSGINQGIIRAFKEGLLSSTSLIAGGEAAEEAISLAKKNPGLDMGIHLILCDETPVLPTEDISSITSGRPHFPPRKHLQRAIFAHKINHREIEAEWNAQVEKVLNAAIPITHMDGHQFIHLFPGLFPICLKIARKHKIPFVRTSNDDLATLEASFMRFIQWAYLKLWIKIFVSRAFSSNIRRFSSVGFLMAGGRLNRSVLLKNIDSLRQRKPIPLVEFILHPGIGDSHTAYKYSHWQYDWKKDLDLLTDSALKKALDLRGVELTSFGKEL